MRESHRHRRAFAIAALLVGAATLVALSLAWSVRSASPEATQPPPKATRPAPTADLHGFPRTFHLYGDGPLDELARYDMLVLPHSIDIGGLRARDPDGIFLLQPTLTGSNGTDFVHITAPGGAVGWGGATDTTRVGKPLGTIPPIDPNWDFLHNADGSLATIGGKILGWNLAAPPDEGVPAEVAKVFAYAAKRDGLYCTVRIGKPGNQKRVPCWNGVHSDNWIYSAIGASWFYGSALDANRDGVVDDENTLKRNWSNGLARAGILLRAYLPGMIVGGNGAWYESNLYAGSDPAGWLKASNYTLVEDLQQFAPSTLLSAASTWLNFRDPLGQARYMSVLQRATDASGNVLLWPQGDCNTAAAENRPDVLRSMRWGLTMSLMMGVYYEIVGDFYGNGVNCRWWFDEFDGGIGVRRRGYLGLPLGPYRKLSNGVYRRDFDHGIAVNNSTSQAQTINLHGTYRRLRGTQDATINDGATVNSVTLQPHDGIILLSTTG